MQINTFSMLRPFNLNRLCCSVHKQAWHFGKTQHKAGKGIQVLGIGTKLSLQSNLMLGYVMGLHCMCKHIHRKPVNAYYTQQAVAVTTCKVLQHSTAQIKHPTINDQPAEQSMNKQPMINDQQAEF